MVGARCTTPPSSAERASPHRPDKSGQLRVIDWYDQRESNPAGSVHATARDLGAWLQFQLGDGSFRGTKLLSTAALAETHTPQIALRLEGLPRAANPDTQLMSYAIGWVVQDYRGQLIVSHAGALDGFRAQITLLPNSGLGFALLCNRDQTRMNLALGNTLIDRLLGLPERDWNGYYQKLVEEENSLKAAAQRLRNKEATDNPPSDSLDQFAGRYEHPAYGAAVVTHRDGGLLWEWSGFRGMLKHQGGERFTVLDENLVDNSLQFHVKEGRVVALRFLNLDFQRRGP
jgi:CubicO group peptidase (beta-lactamase class C family)